jgi:hypothetical protein
MEILPVSSLGHGREGGLPLLGLAPKPLSGWRFSRIV